MSEEWGPWIEHDGKGCPLPAGTVVEFISASGHRDIGPVRAGKTFSVTATVPGRWVRARRQNRTATWWDWLLERPFAGEIVSYRIRKPKALEQLRNIARDVETPLVNTPKEPVRA